MTESGDDLVENQNDSFAVADSSKALQELLLRQDTADVVGDRFENHAGNLVGIPLHGLFNVVQIVESADQRVLHRLVQHARRTGIPLVDHLELADDVAQYVVVPPVVAALKLDDFPSLRDRTREADGMKRRLRAGAAHEHLLDRRNVVHDLPREVQLHAGRRNAIEVRIPDRIDHAIDDRLMTVSENDRREGGMVVNVAFVVLVPHVGATGAADAERGIDDANRGMQSPGRILRRLFVETEVPVVRNLQVRCRGSH